MEELALALREYTRFLAACKLLEYGLSRDMTVIRPSIEILQQITKVKE